MSLRLPNDPSSANPVAIARLDGYAWIICERGYANVVALPESNAASDENTVWGVVYNMSAEDEVVLDRFEGHDDTRNPHPDINPDPQTQRQRPYLQGDWDYNKHYLPVTVTKWLRDPNDYGVGVKDWNSDTPGPTNTTIRVLVYVDEYRVRPGKINDPYIGRMNRGVRESVDLGLPKSWVDKVMRNFFPEGIEVDEEGYIGTDEGYVEADATEAGDELKEKDLKEMSENQKKTQE